MLCMRLGACESVCMCGGGAACEGRSAHAPPLLTCHTYPTRQTQVHAHLLMQMQMHIHAHARAPRTVTGTPCPLCSTRPWSAPPCGSLPWSLAPTTCPTASLCGGWSAARGLCLWRRWLPCQAMPAGCFAATGGGRWAFILGQGTPPCVLCKLTCTAGAPQVGAPRLHGRRPRDVARQPDVVSWASPLPPSHPVYKEGQGDP